MSIKQATLYRMVTADHICPYGLKAKDLLKRQGFTIDDRTLDSKEAAAAFKQEHKVETTPQVFFEGQRIGGYDALRAYLGIEAKDTEAVTYKPVIAVFAMSFLMALAASWATLGAVVSLRSLEWFIAISMCVLAIQKLRDLEAFSFQFITYDLLAMRVVRYSYVYPFAEAFAGIGMLAGVLTPVVVAVALFIGTIGALSVVKAVYIDRRELKCACVGGNSNVPLGFVSLTENLMMVSMAIWMALKWVQ